MPFDSAFSDYVPLFKKKMVNSKLVTANKKLRRACSNPF